MRTELMKLGVGEQAKIEVKLKDGSKVKGYLREVKEHDFVVMDEATNAEVAIPYPQVQKAKGHNLNGGVKILLTVGIALFVCVLWAIAAGRSS